MGRVHHFPDPSQVDPAEGHQTVKYEYSLDGHVEGWFSDYDGKCNFCGEDLAPPAVYFFSGYKTHWFHKKCAQTFGLALIKDAARHDYFHHGQIKNAVDRMANGHQ